MYLTKSYPLNCACEQEFMYNGQVLLLDQRTQRVYVSPDGRSWPQLLGKLTVSGRPHVVGLKTPATMEVAGVHEHQSQLQDVLVSGFTMRLSPEPLVVGFLTPRAAERPRDTHVGDPAQRPVDAPGRLPAV